MLCIKRLVTPYPHRPWRLPRRLLLLLVVVGIIAWLFGGRWERHPHKWRDSTIEAGR